MKLLIIFLICSLFSLASFAKSTQKSTAASSQVETPVAQCPSKERTTDAKVILNSDNPAENNNTNQSATKDAAN